MGRISIFVYNKPITINENIESNTAILFNKDKINKGLSIFTISPYSTKNKFTAAKNWIRAGIFSPKEIVETIEINITRKESPTYKKKNEFKFLRGRRW